MRHADMPRTRRGCHSWTLYVKTSHVPAPRFAPGHEHERREGCRSRTKCKRLPGASAATRPRTRREGCRSRTKMRTPPNASHLPHASDATPRGHAEGCRTKVRMPPTSQRRDTPQDTRGLSFADENANAFHAPVLRHGQNTQRVVVRGRYNYVNTSHLPAPRRPADTQRVRSRTKMRARPTRRVPTPCEHAEGCRSQTRMRAPPARQRAL